LFLAAFLATAWAAAAVGRQPDSDYVGCSGFRWPSDFAVLSGRCDREAIGGVLRPTGATAIGVHPDTHQNRWTATLIGASVSGLIARKMAREIDDGDRACLGHTLEVGKPGRAVVWDNSTTGVHFEMVPQDGRNEIAGLCRDFKLWARTGSGHSERRGKACEKAPGLWQLSRV
jgi:surface antigen